MKWDGNKIWALDLGFIRQGQARFTSPFTGKSETVSWSIKTLAAELLPISLVECHIQAMGCEAYGYGDSIFFRSSLTQAFAESWERLWMHAFRTVPSNDVKSSNGFACGASREAALSKAREELIERAIFLSAWNSRKGWHKVPVSGLRNAMVSAILSKKGWQLRFFHITEARLGAIVCGLGTKPNGGILFDCCHLSQGKKIHRTQSKVLGSLLRSSLANNNKGIIDALPQKGVPEDHLAFYRNPAHYEAFNFLDQQRNAESYCVELGHYDEIKSQLLVAIEHFPFVAISTNPYWPQLSWGQESLKGSQNQWPHPLA